jgi:hypothetical protein
MYPVIVGIVLLVLGALAASNSLYVVKRAVRVWPRTLDRRGVEAFASYEFLVRFLGLVVALIGIGLILFELVER